MARPPSPSQKRYRGRILANIVSARRHIQSLIVLNTKYRSLPCSHYPTQLAADADITVMVNAVVMLDRLHAALGPVPIRIGCPTT